MHKKFIDAVLISFFLTCIIIVGTVLVTDYFFPSTGNVKTCEVELYWNQQLTQPATQLDWGLVNPNSTVIKTLYIHNPSTTNLTLSFYVSDWQPTNAGSVLSITWNLENQTLLIDETKTVTLTLTCEMDTQNITDFSNMLHFVGSEII